MKNSEPNNGSSQQAPRRPQGAPRKALTPETLRAWSARAGAIAAVLVVIYAGGWLHGRAQVAAVKRDFTARLAASDSTATTLQESLTTAEARADLQECVLWLYRGRGELERHNFGTAREHVSRAAQAFKKVPPEETGASSTDLLAIARGLEEIELDVSPDVSLQRDRILKVILRLDAVLLQN